MYYYKTKDSKIWWSLQSPKKLNDDVIEITEEEWNAHQKEIDDEINKWL